MTGLSRTALSCAAILRTATSRTGIKALFGALALALIVSVSTEAARKYVKLRDLAWLAGSWSNDTLRVYYTDHEHGALIGVAKPISKPVKPGSRQALTRIYLDDWDKIERFSSEKKGVRLRVYVSGELEGEYISAQLHRTIVTFESATETGDGQSLRKITYRILLPDTLLVIDEQTVVTDGSQKNVADTTMFRRSKK